MFINLSYPINGLSPIKVGGTGTTAKIFPAVAASVPVNAAQPVVPGQLVGGPAALLIPANGSYEGQLFSVNISGTIVTGTTISPTINLVIQSGSSLTAASNTTVATFTAAFAAAVSTKYNFSLSLTLSGDSASGLVCASPKLSEAQINGADQALTLTNLTGVSFLSGAATGQNPIFNGNSAPVAISLVCGVTFGVSDAANSASLMAFNIE